MSGVTSQAELDRIRRVYARRAVQGAAGRADGRDPATLLWLHQRERLLLSGVRAHCDAPLEDLEILDVGCGAGGELLRLLNHGADPTRIHGIDLREAPIRLARERLPSADLRVANAGELPYPSNSMDLVVQLTMLSSILDANVRSAAAREMSRVARPGGVIISYDLWINPLNRDTRGLTRRRLRELFPGQRVDARSVTLAPPLARWVCRRSFGLAAALQAVPPLRTHLLAFITPPAREVGS
jgi:SAM-dependent methyltransferase